MRSEKSGPILTIQYLRAVAAAMVVFHHAMAVPELAPYYSRPIGQFGVDLFFVISGFIMWTTTTTGRYGPLSFYVARIVRVVPIYWIYTTLFLAMALLVPGALFSAAVDPLHVLKSYLFIPAEHPRGGMVPLYTLGWTLNYEMFFYFIFGLGLLVQNRIVRLISVVSVLTLLVGIGRLATVPETVFGFYTNPIVLEFAFGILIAVAASRVEGSSTALGSALIAGAVACLVFFYTRDTLGDRIYVNGVPAVIMMVGALLLERKAQSMPSQLGKLLGDASYSIYLAHPFAMRISYFAISMWSGKLTTSGGLILLATAQVIAGVAGGVLGYFILEQPIIGAGRWIRLKKAWN